MEIEKLEGAGLGKEEDRFNFRQKELRVLGGFPVGDVQQAGLELWRNTRIGKVCLEFKLIKIITEPGEWMEIKGEDGQRTRRIKLRVHDGNTGKVGP